MINVEIIKEIRPNQVEVYDSSNDKSQTYSKQVLKRYFELGKINIKNPKRLYSTI